MEKKLNKILSFIKFCSDGAVEKIEQLNKSPRLIVLDSNMIVSLGYSHPSPVKSPSCIYTRASASESSPLDSSFPAKTASYATYDNVKKQTVTVTDPGNATLGEDYGYEQAESATRLKLETNPLALLDNDE